MSSSTTTDYTPCLFRFHLPITPTTIEHTHPVPTFILKPTAAKKASPAYHAAYIDILTLITAQHHEECLSALASAKTTCLSCNAPATDALKAPQSFLHLEDSLILIRVGPVCGEARCQGVVKGRMMVDVEGIVEESRMGGGAAYGVMKCKVCGVDGAKRCAGCGEVAYCGRECQKVGWKEHKGECHRGYRPGKEVRVKVKDGDGEEEGEGVEVNLPYETV